jgi:hypothetical protein
VGHRVRVSRYVGAGGNGRGGYRGTCSETDLLINHALIVLLVYDHGGQYANEGCGDRQRDQQKVVRSRPLEIHFTPWFDLHEKVASYIQDAKPQIHLREVLEFGNLAAS